MLQVNHIYNGDCLELIEQIDTGTIDCICTDPPYLYLQKDRHKNKHEGHLGEEFFDRPFDEDALFAQWKRVLKPEGMIVLFGRGASFHRWNVKLNELGFPFKEEVVWYKHLPSSPVTPITRVHETVSLLGNGKINKCHFKSSEYFVYHPESLVTSIQDIGVAIRNQDYLKDLLDFVQSQLGTSSPLLRGAGGFPEEQGGEDTNKGRLKKSKFHITCMLKNKIPRHIQTLQRLKEVRERSVIETHEDVQHRVHPTQKPVRLLERLLALTSQPGDLVLDCFSGSGTTAIACQNTQRRFIGFELDKIFCEESIKRVNNNATLF